MTSLVRCELIFDVPFQTITLYFSVYIIEHFLHKNYLSQEFVRLMVKRLKVLLYNMKL